jgi:hypothetical protein
MGEASYTLIDDNGVEFFLSDEDKRRRNGEDVDADKTRKKNETLTDVLKADPAYQRARRAEVRRDDRVWWIKAGRGKIGTNNDNA